MTVTTWLRSLLEGPQPITRREMSRIGAPALLRRSRRMARAVPVGGGAVLCRVLTRYRLFVSADDVGFGTPIMLDGVWENWLTAFMARRVRPGMTLVDAGANHGYYTLLFAHLTGARGRVAAIEPHPRTAALLRRSVYANGFQAWTEVFETAAGAQDGVILTLQASTSEPKNAHLTADAAEAGHDAHSVAGARLDTLLADWPRIDFIKADVEGAEEAFVEGAWSILTRDRPTLVLEFNAYRCADPGALLDRLEALYGRIGVVTRQGAVIYVPRAVLEDRDRREDWILILQPA